MKFFILRHAEDSTKIIGGNSKIVLTPKGKDQALELSHFILSHKQEFNIEKIVSSDLLRAVQTVAPLAKALHLKIDTNKLFRALDWGDLNGLSLRQANQN